MMWGYYDGWAWVWMAAMMIAVWGGILAVAVYAIRAFASRRGGDDAMNILRRRLAGGEITPEEFERTRKALM
jgi:uncharacterized membrane protein